MLTSQINLSKKDKVPDLLFSRIIWKAAKAEDSEMPVPRRIVFVKVKAEQEEDD